MSKETSVSLSSPDGSVHMIMLVGPQHASKADVQKTSRFLNSLKPSESPTSQPKSTKHSMLPQRPKPTQSA
jgi:hypothetical protein